MDLYRGDSATDPTLGTKSYWSNNESHAEEFAGSNIPGAPDLALYLADIEPVDVLDLRTDDPWETLFTATGIDLRERTGRRQDLLHRVLDQLVALDFDWLARFADYGANDYPHRDGGVEEWIYLGTGDVPATVVRAVPNTWR